MKRGGEDQRSTSETVQLKAGGPAPQLFSVCVVFLLLSPQDLSLLLGTPCDSGRAQHVLAGTCGSSPAVVRGTHLLTMRLLRTQAGAVTCGASGLAVTSSVTLTGRRN